MLNGVSTNGSSVVQIQLGSSSFSTTGYSCTTFISVFTGGASSQAAANSTTGIATEVSNGNITSESIRNGYCIFNLFGSNTWVANGLINSTGVTVVLASTAGVSPALSGALDRVRITTVNGTDTFDAGSVNIMYEG